MPKILLNPALDLINDKKSQLLCQKSTILRKSIAFEHYNNL